MILALQKRIEELESRFSGGDPGQIVAVMPVRVIEHRIIAGYCGVCGKRYMPKLDLSGEVVGSHRVGIRLMSLIAYLAIKGRMRPVGGKMDKTDTSRHSRPPTKSSYS